MSKVVILSGSPSAISRTDLVLRNVQSLLEKKGFSVTYVSVLDIPPEDLLFANFNSLSLKRITQSIKEADGIIIGSPVYKASYTGVLKALMDLLPEGVLKGKSVFPLMVGGSKAHLLAIDFSLKPLITTLKGNPSHGIYILDSDIDKKSKRNPIIDKELIHRLHRQVDEFVDAVNLAVPIHSN